MPVLLSKLPVQLLAAALVWLVAAGSAADPAAPYGRDYVRAGASWPAEVPAPAAGLAAAPEPAAVAELERRLREEESRSGPYAASLSEPLNDLARALDALERYDEAQALRARALHLLRINEGLYSPLQVPLVRDQLEADRRSGDFDALDARYVYYHRLFGNGLPPYTPLRFAATLEYFRWQREALRRGLDGDPQQRLSELLRSGDELIERLGPGDAGAEAGVNPQFLRDAVLNQLRNYYLFAVLVRPPQRELDPFAPRRPGFGNDVDDFDMLRQRLENQRRALRARGDALLRELLEGGTALEPVDRALLQRERGDWLQWWGASRTAAEHYRASWQTLESAGQGSLAEEWYREPVPLPDNGVFLDADQPVAGSATLRVEVSEQGVARADFTLVAPQPARQVERLLRRVRETRFRPAMAGGERRAAVLSDWQAVAFE